ncbi:MAG TPA: OmpH family outer membrane protein [Pyrinomonadaceae bacterium]|nr:OmpH family outer membrane protein [Pyrinomonadaceae bacterium]
MRNHFFPISALIVLAFATSISAQQQPARPPASQPTATPAPTAAVVALPNSKVAVIYSDAFMDQKAGITKFSSVLAKLNGEFQKTKDDLTASQTRAQTLEDEINKLRSAPEGTPIDQRSLQTKIDQLEQLKKDIQRKAEDAQNAYNRRRNELFEPLQREIAVALESFAKSRGINVMIDASAVPLMYAAENIDITRAFIADFNSKNPVAASSTPAPQ